MQMGVKGFWMGFMISLIALDIFVAYLVIWADWKPQVLSNPNDSVVLDSSDDEAPGDGSWLCRTNDLDDDYYENETK